jgi:hypothetical protein
MEQKSLKSVKKSQLKISESYDTDLVKGLRYVRYMKCWKFSDYSDIFIILSVPHYNELNIRIRKKEDYKKLIRELQELIVGLKLLYKKNK